MCPRVNCDPHLQAPHPAEVMETLSGNSALCESVLPTQNCWAEGLYSAMW